MLGGTTPFVGGIMRNALLRFSTASRAIEDGTLLEFVLSTVSHGDDTQYTLSSTSRSIGGREFEAEVNTLVGPFTVIGYCFRSAESSSDALLQPVCRHSSDLQ